MRAELAAALCSELELSLFVQIVCLSLRPDKWICMGRVLSSLFTRIRVFNSLKTPSANHYTFTVSVTIMIHEPYNGRLYSPKVVKDIKFVAHSSTLVRDFLHNTEAYVTTLTTLINDISTTTDDFRKKICLCYKK